MATTILRTAASLTDMSKRTLWRRLSAGLLRRAGLTAQGGHAQLLLAQVFAGTGLELSPELEALVLDADAGVAEAQCDLGLTLLSQKKPVEALRWLRAAARQNYPEALHQLGRCHIAGVGVEPDEAQGIALIAQAAALSHATARHMIHWLNNPARSRLSPAEIDARLDAIEQKVVFEALVQTALPGTGSGGFD